MQDQPTNVVGRRVGAFLIDTVVVWLVVALLWILFTDRLDADTTVGGGIVIGDTRYGFHEDSGGKRGAWALLSIIASLVVFVVIPGLRGTSPGRALTGIRLVKSDGGHPGVGRAFVRYLLWIVDAFPYFIPNLLGFILVLTTKGNRRVGDMAAGTYTVRADAAGQPIDRIVPALAQPGPGLGYAHVPPPQYVGPSPGAQPQQGQWPQPPPPGQGPPPQPPPQQPQPQPPPQQPQQPQPPPQQPQPPPQQPQPPPQQGHGQPPPPPPSPPG